MKQAIHQLVEHAIRDAMEDGTFPHGSIPAFEVLTPDTDEHGHVATNVAMKLAPLIKKSPLEIANALVPKIEKRAKKIFARVDVAPPGFINAFYDDRFLAGQVELILKGGKDYWTHNEKQEKKVQVEFISANPTGPLTAANGRGGFFGDVLTNVLQSQGNETDREFYVNDRGVQVDVLAESVARRYLQANKVDIDFPEELYQGAYVTDLAKELGKEIEAKDIDEAVKAFKKLALSAMINDIKRVAKDVMGIKFKKFFSEASLYRPKKTADELLKRLEKEDLAYKKEGAVWMKTTRYGDDKDRVLVKSDGEMTYFLSDILYLDNRFNTRGYDRIIEVWGADHHGYVARFKAAAEAIAPKKKVDFAIVQLVKLVRDGEEVKMSKRKGNFVTIEEVIEEIGQDAARFNFLTSSLNSHMELDLELAKEQSERNPVYYVQYAHARMSNILKNVGKVRVPDDPQFSTNEEFALIRQLMRSPELLERIADTLDVYTLPQYTLDLARAFHKFYDRNRVIDEGEVNTERVALVMATKMVLGGMLELMGVSAPEKM